MELMDRDLESMMNDDNLIKNMSLEQKIDLMKQIIEGLMFLHQKGIVHRDMKPKNILINDSEMSIKISDLGISKIMEQNQQGDSNTLGFTPRYCSLEQTLGEVDFAGDIWSCCLILYELVSNKKPWLNLSIYMIIHKLYLQADPLDSSTLSLLLSNNPSHHSILTQLIHVIRQGLDYNQHNRPTAIQLYNILQSLQ